MYRFHQALIARSRLTGADEAVAGLRADAEQVPAVVDEGSSAYRRFAADGATRTWRVPWRSSSGPPRSPDRGIRTGPRC